jgi:hypothetical protein
LEHLITVESEQSPDLNKKYPCCIDGQNHAPFEDIGGIFGYLDILDALQDLNIQDMTITCKLSRMK